MENMPLAEEYAVALRVDDMIGSDHEGMDHGSFVMSGGVYEFWSDTDVQNPSLEESKAPESFIFLMDRCWVRVQKKEN